MAQPSSQHQQNNNHLLRRRTASSNSSDSPSSSPTQFSSSESDLDLPLWPRNKLTVILLLMALSFFFGITVFLFVTLESDHLTSHVDAATSEGVEVIYKMYNRLTIPFIYFFQFELTKRYRRYTVSFISGFCLRILLNSCLYILQLRLRV